MKKLLVGVVLLAALLTGCNEVQYKMSGVTVVSKSTEQYSCRGTCDRYYVTVDKDGNKLTFSTNSESYKLVSEGYKYNLTKYGEEVGRAGFIVLTPMDIEKEGNK
jgi:hypothetical protein